MAVVFNQSYVGRAIGIDVADGSTQPAKGLSFGVNYSMNNYSPSELAGSWKRAMQNAVDKSAAYFTSPGNRWMDIPLGAATGLLLGGKKGGVVGALVGGATAGYTAWKYKAGNRGIPEGPQFSSAGVLDSAYTGSSTLKDWTQNAQKELSAIIKPLGLITTSTISFEESATFNGDVVIAGSNMLPGKVSLGGIVFDSVCTASGVQNRRHGLEPILEYYYYHRVSKAGSVGTKGGPTTSTTILFGKTVLKGWVVGMDAEPQNMDYRIWKWSINLLVDPNYYPQPSKEPTARSPGGITGQQVGEGSSRYQANTGNSLGSGTRFINTNPR